MGHWPYCHPIEDLLLPQVERHEGLARQRITQGPIAQLLVEEWGLEPQRVADAIAGKAASRGEQITTSMLSGPIDVDKIDYLARDSHHAGVPYGKHFDAARLMSSLCLNESGTAVAVTDKGRTAAELMVFARYVMFSEVYWHHAVRAATAMLQRAVYLRAARIDWPSLYESTDLDFPHLIMGADNAGPSWELVDGLFGSRRWLYKRLAQYSLAESPELYQQVARRPYDWLVGLAERLAESLQARSGLKIAAHEILVDAPPQKLEVQCNVEVSFSRPPQFRPLADVSPVVETLAQRQFDDYVKRVRVYCHPRLRGPLSELPIDDIVASVLAGS